MRRIFLLVWGAIGSIIMLLALVIHGWACCQRNQVANGHASDYQACVLPFDVVQNELVAERLVRYDGAFLEDGSGTEITDAAALIVRNISDTGMASATVTIEQGERTLIFEATDIPPNSAVLVLERSGQLYSSQPLNTCTGSVILDDLGWLPEEYVAVHDADMGSVDITNITGRTLHNVRLLYKTEYADGLFYLGGITYVTVISRLAPAETVRLYPEHYASGCSKIVRVIFDDKIAPLALRGAILIKPLKGNPAAADAWGD